MEATIHVLICTTITVTRLLQSNTARSDVYQILETTCMEDLGRTMHGGWSDEALL